MTVLLRSVLSRNYIISCVCVFLYPISDAWWIDFYPAAFHWCESMRDKVRCWRPVQQNASNWRWCSQQISINCRTKRKIHYWNVNNRHIWPFTNHNWPACCQLAIVLAVSNHRKNYLFNVWHLQWIGLVSCRFDSQWVCSWTLCLRRVAAKWYFILGDSRWEYANECSHVGFHQILCSITSHVPYNQWRSPFDVGQW